MSSTTTPSKSPKKENTDLGNPYPTNKPEVWFNTIKPTVDLLSLSLWSEELVTKFLCTNLFLLITCSTISLMEPPSDLNL